jgi:hypothetical protein
MLLRENYGIVSKSEKDFSRGVSYVKMGNEFVYSGPTDNMISYICEMDRHVEAGEIPQVLLEKYERGSVLHVFYNRGQDGKVAAIIGEITGMIPFKNSGETGDMGRNKTEYGKGTMKELCKKSERTKIPVIYREDGGMPIDHGFMECEYPLLGLLTEITNGLGDEGHILIGDTASCFYFDAKYGCKRALVNDFDFVFKGNPADRPDIFGKVYNSPLIRSERTKITLGDSTARDMIVFDKYPRYLSERELFDNCCLFHDTVGPIKVRQEDFGKNIFQVATDRGVSRVSVAEPPLIAATMGNPRSYQKKRRMFIQHMIRSFDPGEAQSIGEKTKEYFREAISAGRLGIDDFEYPQRDFSMIARKIGDESLQKFVKAAYNI